MVNHSRPTVNGSGYKMQGPPGLGFAAASAPAGGGGPRPGGGLHVVAGWPWPPAGVVDEQRLWSTMPAGP